MVVAPGADLAVGVATAPDALGPHQHHRTTGHGQVSGLDPPATVGHRSDTTAATADHFNGGLHVDHLRLGADHEPGHAKQRGGALATYFTVKGLLLQLVTNRRVARPLAAVVDLWPARPPHPAPRFIT